MYTIWASHSGTQQPLVDATEQAINEAECQIELLHFRKVFVDDQGNPVAEDMLKQNERIARLINDIGDSRGVVFFLCDEFVKSEHCLAELLAVLWHKTNNHFAVVRMNEDQSYIENLVQAITDPAIAQLVSKSLLRPDNYIKLSSEQIEETLRERLKDKIYTSDTNPESIMGSLKEYREGNVSKRPPFDVAAHYRLWQNYGDGSLLRKHFNTYDPITVDGKSDGKLLNYADYVATELFERDNVGAISQFLPNQLREFVTIHGAAGAASLASTQSVVRIFGGYFALMLFDKDWMAQQNCLESDRIQVNLRLPGSIHNPVFINVIVAGTAQKVPRITLADGELSGQDCILKLTDKVDIGSGKEPELRKAYYSKIVDSLWSVVCGDEAAPQDDKEETLLSHDNRTKLIGNFNLRFGKGANRLAYVEIDQPLINNLAPELPRYLDEYIKALNAMDEKDENINIPMVLYRIDQSASHVKGVATKISLLKEIIAIAEGK